MVVILILLCDACRVIRVTYIGMCMRYLNVCMTEAQSLPVRSVSDDQLLSHSEAFTDVVRGSMPESSRLRCDSDDFQNLTKCDDIETKQRPVCKHDVPERCSSSCWTFAGCNDAAGQRCQLPQHDMTKTESWPSVTQQSSMTKSKSSDNCCHPDDNAIDQSTVHKATATHFYPASW